MKPLSRPGFSAIIFTLLFATPARANLSWTNVGPFASTFCIACSADGAKVVALKANFPWALASTNWGATWTSNSVPVEPWVSVASSADGVKLAAVSGNGKIYTSTNSGASWVLRAMPGNFPTSIASSADGTRLMETGVIFVSDAPSRGSIYISIDSGVTWTLSLDGQAPFPFGPYSSYFSDAAISSDGLTLAAVSAVTEGGFFGGGEVIYGTIHEKSSSGSWTEAEPFLNWTAIAVSAGGDKQVAAASHYESGSIFGMEGGIYTSTNSGATWQARAVPDAYWAAVASSANGTRLLAVANGPLYTSGDSGVTWVSNNVPWLNWTGAACSADGAFLAAASPQGIYVSRSTPSPVIVRARAGNTLTLSWLVPSLPFTLERTATLSTPDWAPVSGVALDLSTLRYSAHLALTNAPGFFRLSH